MTFIRKVSLGVCACLMLSSACRNQAWKPFRDKEGAFSVSMPATPTVENNSSPSPVGDIQVKAFVATTTDRRTVFMVAYNDYPEAMLESFEPQDILASAAEGALAGGGKLESKQPTTLFSHPALTVEALVQGELHYDGRFLLAKNRLFQVSVVGPDNAVSDEDKARFFGSFALASDPASAASTR